MDNRLKPGHLRLMAACERGSWLLVFQLWSREFSDLFAWGYISGGKLTPTGRSALRAAGWAP